MSHYILLSIAILLGAFYTTAAVAIKLFSKKNVNEYFELINKSIIYDKFTSNISVLLLLCGFLRSVSSITIFFCILNLFTFHDLQPNLVLALSISILITSIFTVAIPIPIARYNSDKFLIKTIGLLNLSVTIFKPTTSVLNFFDIIVKRISDHNPEDDNDAADRILYIVEEHEEDGQVDVEQKLMIEAVFDLKDTTADQIMTPRTDVMGLEIDATLEDIKRFIATEGHSRIPVYKDNLDHIIGILYAKDLLKFLNSNEEFNIKENLRDVLVIPESKIITDLLKEFKAKKNSHRNGAR